ncbi:MAG: FAD-binding protein [Candidatus Bathyarchaeota archaeon]|jgi:fumarate reductase (CoM/CoB) subunit A
MSTYHKSEILVIGTGGAGLRAAIEAHERGAEVLVVCKAPAGYNNATVVAGGGFRAAVKGFTAKEHFEDTLRVGNYLNDPHLVEVFTREGGMRVLELARFGVDYRVRRGGISVGDTPGIMGLGMTKPMVEYLRGRGVNIIENVIVTRLLKSGGSVVGAVGYDVKGDEPVLFSSKVVILATGGAGALYERTDCPLRVTGDGYSLAYHAGAELRDMEFVQFFPVALAEPGHPPFLLGGLLTEEGRIVNRHGEEIPAKHGVKDRPFVLKSRGPLSVAIMREIHSGNGVEGAVLLDATEVFRNRSDEELFYLGRISYIREHLKADEKLIKIAPIAHFNMGGVIADENGRTSVPALFAAGEVVGGVHGANRHGGNALTDITVFGARAGAAAAKNVNDLDLEPVERLAEPELKRYRTFRKGGGVSPKQIISELRSLMWTRVGPVRMGQSLEEALEQVRGFKEEASHMHPTDSTEMLVALEVPMELDAAEFIIRAALKRRESRGAHFRIDYPKLDEDWKKTVVLKKGPDGKPKVSTKSV